MNHEELQRAISDTLEKIEYIKSEIDQATDSSERKKLIRQKRELQYLQLWHIEQLEALRIPD